jgi:hypothetical protein
VKTMATWDDVSRIALALPEVVETTDSNGLKWTVRKNYFVYERPLRKRDIDDLGDTFPRGPILGARTADLDDKRGLIGSDPAVFFTTPHFDGYPSVLVQLEKIDEQQLREVITDAWLCRAPKRLAAAYLAAE